MAYNIGTVEGHIKLTYSGGRALRSLDSDMRKAKGSMGGTTAAAAGLGSRLSGSLKAGAVGAAAAIGTGLTLALKKSITEARESERVNRQTAAVIKSTGGAAKVTAGQIAELSTSLSNKTGIDDEAVQSGANLLLTFKNIRNETGKGNDIFNQATGTVLDMSAALDQSAKSSAMQLGKALNDPIKGITALSRAGLTFTEGQKEQIATLVESGKRMEAQKMILRELNSQVAGSAAAQADPMKRLGTIVNNLLEKVGTALLPTINKAATAIGKFIQGMMNGKGAGGDFAEILKSIWESAKNFGPIFEVIGKAIGFLFKAFNLIPEPVRKLLASFIMFGPVGTLVIRNFDKIAGAVSSAFNWIKGAVSSVGNFLGGVINRFFISPVKWLIGAWKSVEGALSPIFRWINRAFGKVASFVIAAVKRGFGGPVGFIISNWTKITNFVKGIPSKIKNGLSTIARVISTPFRNGFTAIVDFVKTIPGKIIGALASAGGAIADFGNAIRNWINDATLFGDQISLGPVKVRIPYLAEGGVVGPSTGGARLFVAGEGNKDEWVISQEGPRGKNQALVMEAAKKLGIPGFKKGGKPKKPDYMTPLTNAMDIRRAKLDNARRAFEMSDETLTRDEIEKLYTHYDAQVKGNFGPGKRQKKPKPAQLKNMGLLQLQGLVEAFSKGTAKQKAHQDLVAMQLDRQALGAEAAKAPTSVQAGEAAIEKLMQELTTTNYDEVISQLTSDLGLAQEGYSVGKSEEQLTNELLNNLEGRLTKLRQNLGDTRASNYPTVLQAVRDAIGSTVSEISGLRGGRGTSGASIIEQTATAAQLRYGLFSQMAGNAAALQLGAGGQRLATGPTGTQVFLNGEFKLDSNDAHGSVRKLGSQLSLAL